MLNGGVPTRNIVAHDGEHESFVRAIRDLDVLDLLVCLTLTHTTEMLDHAKQKTDWTRWCSEAKRNIQERQQSALMNWWEPPAAATNKIIVYSVTDQPLTS